MADPQTVAASVSDFEPDPDQGLTLVRDHEGEVSGVIPLCIEVKARVRQDGVIRGVYVVLTERDGTCREVFIETEQMGGRDLFGKLLDATGHGFTRPQEQRVHELLLRATTSPDIQTIETLGRPRWNGDSFEVPAITHLPAVAKNGTMQQHYGPPIVDLTLDAGDDGEAKEAWRSIMRAGAQHPKFGLVLGAVLASPYLKRLSVKGTTVHVGGTSTRGKTRAAKVAMCTMGSCVDNPRLVGTWDTTYAGIVAVLKETGGVAYLLDETSLVSTSTEENLSLVPYAVERGKERQRSDRQGNAREAATFTTNLISTGERDLATSKGGEYARVIQLNAPLIADDDGATIDMLFDQAERYHGWPLRWLVLTGWAPTELELQLPEFDNPIARRHARALAAAKLAFDRVGRGLFNETDEEPPVLDLVAATAELVQDLNESASDTDRLFDEVWSDFCSRPADYGRTIGGAALAGKLCGRDYGTTWVVTPTRVREIAKTLGISDIRPVVRELVKEGRVRPGSKDNRARRALRPSDSVSDVYELVKPEDAFDDLGDRSDADDRTSTGVAA